MADRPGQGNRVSLPPSVDRRRIDRFLVELGRAFRHPARLYLVGGTTLVYEKLRGTTIDIDFAVDVDPDYHAEFMRQIARLKDQLAVNVEEVSPGDFIPLPSGCIGSDEKLSIRWREHGRR